MPWSPDPDALRGRVAVVAGATRGAGRGIAAALGEAGPTVVCTGRTTRSARSEYNRPETIEETATRLGGTGIAAVVDHLMLDAFGVSEPNWRDAFDPARGNCGLRAPADFALSESPRYVGRAVAALASDPGRSRWNQQSVTAARLAREYGFTDLDGTRPDIWRYIEEARERGVPADLGDYR